MKTNKSVELNDSVKSIEDICASLDLLMNRHDKLTQNMKNRKPTQNKMYSFGVK